MSKIHIEHDGIPLCRTWATAPKTISMVKWLHSIPEPNTVCLNCLRIIRATITPTVISRPLQSTSKQE